MALSKVQPTKCSRSLSKENCHKKSSSPSSSNYNYDVFNVIKYTI